MEAIVYVFFINLWATDLRNDRNGKSKMAKFEDPSGFKEWSFYDGLKFWKFKTSCMEEVAVTVIL